MRALLAVRLPVAWLFLTSIIAATIFVLWKVAILDAPPDGRLLVSTPAPFSDASVAAGDPQARATITALSEELAGLRASVTAVAGGDSRTALPSPRAVGGAQAESPFASTATPDQPVQSAQVVVPQNGDSLGRVPTTATSTGVKPTASPQATSVLSPEQGAPSSDKVNINTASIGELERLPAIGPVLAARIIEYREANGPFKSTEGIMQVSGIKQGIYGRIRDYITVEP